MITTTSKPLRITLRDIRGFRALAIFGYLTIKQMKRLLFPDANEGTVNNRQHALCGLTRDPETQYESRDFAYPKAGTVAHGGRDSKTAAYFLTTSNVRNIMRYLRRHDLLALAGEIQDFPTTERRDYANKTLAHEIGISEWGVTLHEYAEDTGDTIAFWERTSTAKYLTQYLNQDAQIIADGKTDTKTLRFQPDAVFCLKHDGRLLISFFEFDRATESMKQWRKKIAGYVALRDSGKLPELLLYFSDKYNLGLSPEACAQGELLVFTATPSEYRRNKLLREISRMDRHRTHFLFSSMTETNRHTILRDIWLSAEDYRPVLAAERALPRQMRNSVKDKWILEQVATLPRRSLLSPRTE